VTDSSGGLVARYKYDLWGVRTNDGGTDPSFADWGFTGHLYHSGSALHFAPYRQYDARLGRWISRDPIGESGGINLFAYVSGDPVNLVDPTGETLAIPLALLGAAALAGAAILAWQNSPQGKKALGDLGNGLGNRLRDLFDRPAPVVPQGESPSSDSPSRPIVCPVPNTATPPGPDPDDEDRPPEPRGKNRKKPGKLGEFKGRDALRAENNVARDAGRAARLNKDQQRELHDRISGQGLNYKQILDIAKQIASGQ
jgi:RHS repeat-associated protein